MISLRLVLLFCGLAASQSALEWWQTASFYQVYPRSFMDKLNADGIGDILGITMKLDHFVDADIGGVWLSPIYTSPMKDFGYDISNFTDIDPIFGTMADFEELVTECHNRGLKLIMDLVPNHSSDEHEWFIKSVVREQPYTDYYTWVNATEFNSSTGEPLPPNNWLSVFGGSAWTWSEERQQFYLHQFHEGQPDLNFRNPAVLQEIKDVMIFWLDKGVDGFRMDAVPHLMEDQTFPDEPPSNDPNFKPDQWGSLNHTYTKDLPELYDIIIELRATLDAKQAELGRPLVMMAEAYTDIAHTMMYYGNETHPGAHFPFNFQLISYLTNDTRAQELEDIIITWMDNMPAGQWANWVVGNHDQPRVASKYGRDFGVAVAIMGLLLPGTSFTYNGEEIGMENTWISYNDTEDPSGCQAGPEDYEQFSRDPARTPYQWSAEANAGFSAPDSVEPWLPINPNYVTLNLEAQKAENMSHYHIYQKLTEARANMTSLQQGKLYTNVINEDVFAFTREIPGPDHSILVIVNTGFMIQTVDVRGWGGVSDILVYYTGSLDAIYEADENVQAGTVEVPVRGALVFHFVSVGVSDEDGSAAVPIISILTLSLALLISFVH